MPLKTLLLNPPSFENFDGGASSRWPATREIESYWYPVWLTYPAGLLEGSENVNHINATRVADSRGIRIHEEKQAENHRGGAASLLTIELHAGKNSSSATGTVIHGEQPRLLEFDGIYIETPLEGNLLVCRNLDVPGVIGKIGTILGQHGVNIANFALGRERAGAKPVKALAVVQVDAPVSGAVLDVLAKIEALLEAKPVSLPEPGF